ncbi:adhesion G-protein coupled receptor F3 [Toxotes jaculatrix]|uniref:adhesion G-protein coupled receptor F3 n=1 Tax=Toxotes jaculatrix TaxID=941984 RepID=UPI001B3AA1D7|nr:adhesion G-protein coupled receptor F3 [Toxotes jaculatrix]
MWAFIFLYITGLNICQVTGEDNSTAMHYAKLTIDKGAIGNITKMLKSFELNNNLRVDNLQMTTTCQNVSTKKECTCKSGFRWSDKVCQSDKACCGSDKCTFATNSTYTCISNSAVVIQGSITIEGTSHQNCLADKNSAEFKSCSETLLNKMKTQYSTFKGFDTLEITKYSVGSVIADFVVTTAFSVNPEDLFNKSKVLIKDLKASLLLETTGVVLLSMPDNPVMYNSHHELTCTSQQNLNSQPIWDIKKQGEISIITNGTESEVTITTNGTTLFLKNITELWAGEYTCAYHQKSESYEIVHKAKAVMDVSLLPNIAITTDPGFPHCKGNGDLLKVKGICEIRKSNEPYTVTWTNQGPIKAGIIPKGPFNSSEETVLYEAETVVGCNRSDPGSQLTCTFRNRLDQTRNASVNINIIYVGDRFCQAEGDWEDAKAGFTAVLKCRGEAGQRQRKCKNSTTGAIWEQEVSYCVNKDLQSVLENAQIVDTGLGNRDENAAVVFSRLQNITNNTQRINTFANVNTSVYVLLTMTNKINRIANQSVVNNLIESSSNLLEKDLKNSWTPAKNEKDNLTLAETYLSSVEKLIERTAISDNVKKTNLEVVTCNSTDRSECNNTVFNVNVTLGGSDNAQVKTAGFKQLVDYLPRSNEDYGPNSIVVSTTIDKKQSQTVEVNIDFELLSQRPRNVEIKCVTWDNNTREWSSDGCEWEGPSNVGRCVCRHLSSFAILMSKSPKEVPGIEQITIIGLSISVMSLIISLAIELTVWSAVVKTNTLYLRHTAHVNISVSLLVADCCFLASSKPHDLPEIWCKTFVVLKHFCFLSMFFWMLCLSCTLLHQAVFLFHTVSKKIYLRFSLILGYGCPLLIVAITFLTNQGGAEGVYFHSDTCWLVYSGFFKGSLYTFVIPVGIIVFMNVFSMVVVIMKLLDHPKTTEKSQQTAAKTVMRSVILLTPVFGVTWIFGFLVTLLDLTEGTIALAANYVFTLLNAFQGLFILLTTCLGDKLTRDALLNRLKRNVPASISDSSAKLDSTWKK